MTPHVHRGKCRLRGLIIILKNHAVVKTVYSASTVRLHLQYKIIIENHAVIIQRLQRLQRLHLPPPKKGQKMGKTGIF